MNYKTEITSKALSEIESAYRWMANNLGTTSGETCETTNVSK
jgi:hypothetical protein